MLPETNALHKVMLLALTSEQNVVLHLSALVTIEEADPTALRNVTSPVTSLLIYSSRWMKTAPLISSGAASIVSLLA